MDAIVTVYAIFADENEARTIGHAMVAKKLAACVNILGSCHSVYAWNGGIKAATETPALFKTSAAGAAVLVDAIAERHSYANPAIMVWPVARTLPAYAGWVADSINK